MKLIVTGGIGSGKSTVLKMLQEELPDHEFFSFDKEVAKLYEDEQLQTVLRETFGTCIKKEISDIVFADTEKYLQLVGIFAKPIQKFLDRILSYRHVVFEWPQYFESGVELTTTVRENTQILALYCDAETQKARVLARDGITEEKFNQIIARQLSPEAKCAMADKSLDTGVSLDALHENLVGMFLKDIMTIRAEKFFGKISVYGDLFVEYLINAYSEPHRHYHNLKHLYDVFKALEEFGNIAPSIELAVWFHDAVYSVNPAEYADNEKNSVNAMYRLGWGLIPSAILNVAAEFIMSTKGHRVSSPYILNDKKNHANNLLFLDADLSVLARNSRKFAQYDDEIAREFGQDPKSKGDAFVRARKDAMSHFLSRERIFLSPEFSKYEEQAHINLQHLVVQYGLLIKEDIQ